MSADAYEQEAALGNGTGARGLPLPDWLLDKNSNSITRRHKPVWFSKLQNRGTLQKVMRKIHQLYKTATDLCWEEIWARVELEYREACPEVFADDGRLDTRIERLTDSGILAGCSTEEEKKASLIGDAGSLTDSPVFRSSNTDEEARANNAPTEYD